MLTLGSLAPVVHLLLPGLLQQLRVQHVPTLHACVQSTTCKNIVIAINHVQKLCSTNAKYDQWENTGAFYLYFDKLFKSRLDHRKL